MLIDTITIAIDCMGGDNAPNAVLEGTRQALALQPRLAVLLTGPAEVVESFAAECNSIAGTGEAAAKTANDKFPALAQRVIAVPTTEVILMDEHPAKAIKAKKDSSIVVGCRLVKEKCAQGFFSAGSTGACMAAATVIIGRCKGISRPAIASVLPIPKGDVLLLDIGANADVKAEMILQFAQMGRAYAQGVMGIKNPRLGLLNIGEEQTKGSALAQEAHALLAKRALELGFIGNVEGTDIFQGTYDVIVTDGFTGNVVLKTIEGVAETLFGELKNILAADFKSKLAGGLVAGKLRHLKDTLSAERVGGAPLLGVNGAVVIGHGASGAHAICNGILATAKAVESGIVQS